MNVYFVYCLGREKQKNAAVHTLPSVNAITLGKEQKDWAPRGTVLPRVGAKTHDRSSVFYGEQEPKHMAKLSSLPSVSMKHTAKLPSLSCAPLLAHGKI